jgi:hypothetical protein
MKNATLKIDDRAFRAAFKQWMWRSKKTTIACLEHQAKLFVRDVVRITPPGHWIKMTDSDPRWRPGRPVRLTSMAEARRAGVNAVRGNIAQILVAGRRSKLADAKGLHQRFRDNRGRVRTNLARGRDRRFRVVATALRVEVVRSVNNVGLLASGWNAAARQLGLSLPAWIARHGSSRGRIRISLDPRNMRITITNSVRFAGNVQDLERRVNWALFNRARQMDKQLVHLALVETAEQSGFRVKK